MFKQIYLTRLTESNSRDWLDFFQKNKLTLTIHKATYIKNIGFVSVGEEYSNTFVRNLIKYSNLFVGAGYAEAPVVLDCKLRKDVWELKKNEIRT